jgi:serine/threonine protein kinase
LKDFSIFGGTPGYYPPEVITSKRQSETSDYFCMGEMLFFMLYLDFFNPSVEFREAVEFTRDFAALENGEEDKLKLPDGRTLTADKIKLTDVTVDQKRSLFFFLKSLLHPNPSKRAGSEEIGAFMAGFSAEAVEVAS